MAFNLSDKLGAERVAAHHGSLSRDVRLHAEERLRSGQLKVMVATASLELGIDIGHVDLVCQISSPRRIATLLQRVGRSGHTVRGLPKGRLFPLTRDDFVACAAMVRAAREGELDLIRVPEKPLDVLAQQIVAEVAAQEWDEDALFAFLRGAYPYRGLAREEFDDVVAMLAAGYTTRRGRRAALVHHDAVNRKLRARRGSRMTAITSGGAIPEVFDYRVLLEPEGVFIGTLNEDFAIESIPGDIFQLGNTSWRILRVGSGVVRVADAQGQPPSMPFWLGEAPSRSEEVSAVVSRLRAEADARLPGPEVVRQDGETGALVEWLARDYELPRPAAEQIAAYFAEGKRALGAIPSAVGGRTISLSHVGKAFHLNETSRAHWRGWMRHVLRDQFAVWMFCSFVGMALPCMLSLQFFRNAPVEGTRVAAMTADGMAEQLPEYRTLLWLATLLVGFLVLAVAGDHGNEVARRRRLGGERVAERALLRVGRQVAAVVGRPLLVAERLEAVLQVLVELLVELVGLQLERFLVGAVAAADDALAEREEELAQPLLAPPRFDELEHRMTEVVDQAGIPEVAVALQLAHLRHDVGNRRVTDRHQVQRLPDARHVVGQALVDPERLAAPDERRRDDVELEDVRQLVDDQAVEEVWRIVERHDHAIAFRLGECANTFLRGARDDVLLLELAAGLEDDERDLERKVVLQL
jgi:replicative superfamily II helicase